MPRVVPSLDISRGGQPDKKDGDTPVSIDPDEAFQWIIGAELVAMWTPQASLAKQMTMFEGSKSIG